jgi:hypothetical protein
MRNILHAVIGRTVRLYGAYVKHEGKDEPGIAIRVRKYWGAWDTDILDCPSFLCVAEKLMEVKHGDFKYDKMHEQTKVNIEIPAWAVRPLQELVADFAPKLYNKMKHEAKMMEGVVNALGDACPPQLKAMAQNSSMLYHYQKLHATLNNYDMNAMQQTQQQLAANDEQKEEKPILH